MSDVAATKILEVYDLASQHDINSLEHARAACGITCVWIVLKYLDPDFTPSLQELHDEQKKDEGHFRTSDGVWLQQGSARYARTQGLKAMAVNLNAMGDSDEDINKMYATGRITASERTDYLRLVSELWKHDDTTSRFVAAVNYFIDQDVPIMISMKPGFTNNGSNHRIVCSGYVDDDAVIIDPNDPAPAYKRENLKRLAEHTTGNLLIIYKGVA